MTESAFELARSDWSCIEGRSLKRGVWGEAPAGLGRATDSEDLGALFRSFVALFFVLFFVFLFKSFLDRFGEPFWDVFGAKIVSKYELDIF